MHREKQHAEVLIAAIERRFPDVTDDELMTVIEGETDLFEAMERAVMDALRHEALANGLKGQIEDMQARKARLEERAKSIRAAVLEACETAGIRKHTFPAFTLSVAQGKPAVVVSDEDALPDDLVKIKRVPDKTAIKEALEQGDVPGATFGNAMPRLTVRTK